jgi:alpha-amylase
MVPGETKVLSTGLVPASATQTGIFWYSSNTAIATVSNTGVVTVASRPTAKAFTITATPTPNNLNASGNVISVSQAFTITVAVTSITAIAPSRTTIRIGETRNIFASVSPLNADNRTVTISVTAATNASGQSVADPSTILSVGGDGFQITAIARGTATVRATSQANPSLFSILTLTIST